MVLLDNRLNSTLLRSSNILVLHRLTFSAHAIRRIHPDLKLVALPAKDVISMLPVAGVVAVAEVEGLRAVGGPQALVIEGRGVPDDLVHQLRDAHGVSGWAFASQAEKVGWAGLGVGYVRLVVWAVEIDAVPARREDDVGTNAALARCRGEVLCIELVVHAWCTGVASEVGAGVAAVAVGALQDSVDCAPGWVACEHTEALGGRVSFLVLDIFTLHSAYRLEGSNFPGCGGHIVDEDTTIDLRTEVVAELVAAGGSALVNYGNEILTQHRVA